MFLLSLLTNKDSYNT